MSEDEVQNSEDAAEWDNLAQPPGTRLWWVPANPFTARAGELGTADQQTIASRSYRLAVTLRNSGRTFTRGKVTGPAQSHIAGIIGYTPPRGGKFWAKVNQTDLRLRQYVDDAGAPVLYTSGRHYNQTAGARITFPDQRSLRFPVRGTRLASADMTAVDQDGNEVATYWLSFKWSFLSHIVLPTTVVITVHPGQQLTDELLLALVTSAPWLCGYFYSPPD